MNNQKQLIKLGEQLQKGTSPHKRARARNGLALNPLLKKGGVHQTDDVAFAYKKKRRQVRQTLRKTDWLGGEDV